MPISPDDPSGGEAGSGAGLAGWTDIPCPGLCTMWPCTYVLLSIPASATITCPPDPPGAFGPFITTIKLMACPAGLRGRCWGWTGITPPGPGEEGNIVTTYLLHCENEYLSYPELTFRFENHRRTIGDPDPNITVCWGPVCMTEETCECTPPTEQHADRIGFSHGTAAVSGLTISTSPTNGVCDGGTPATCSWIMAAGDLVIAKCMCQGTCDCFGYQQDLTAVWYCDPTAIPPGFGTLTFALHFYDVLELPAWVLEPVPDPPYGLWVGRVFPVATDSYIEMSRLCQADGTIILAITTVEVGIDLAFEAFIAAYLASGRPCFCATPGGSVVCDPFVETWACTSSTITITAA